ncbi:MAG: PHP domain-containing protein [Thermoplasmata archaeon]|nr:PHP domain-containing protein [Thermoplasmata archaeon]
MNAGPRIDLHLHSDHSSDSSLSVSEIANAIAERGLQGFALTDHQSVEGHAEFVRVRNVHARLLLLRGVEVSAREGHVLVYGVSEVPPRGSPIAELLRWADDRRAVVLLAHPFRWVHGVGRAVAEGASVTGLETRNGRSAPSANAKAAEVAERRGLGTIGGSDAHLREEVGRAFTEFPAGVSTEAELLESLREHRTVAGGDSLAAGARLRLALRYASLRLGRGLRPV